MEALNCMQRSLGGAAFLQLGNEVEAEISISTRAGPSCGPESGKGLLPEAGKPLGWTLGVPSTQLDNNLLIKK